MFATLFSFVIFAVIGFASALIGILFIDGALAVLKFNLSLYAQYWWLALLIPTCVGVVCALILRTHQQTSFANLGEIILVAQRRIDNTWKKDLIAALGTFLSIGGGLSVGQYGPIAHLGGSVGMAISKLQRFVQISPPISAACGVAAAIAAAFNAPITGLMFAHEVILRHFSIRSFAPVAVCAVVGYIVSTDLFNRPLLLEIDSSPQIGIIAFLFFVLLGVLLGLLAYAYVHSIFLLNRQSKGLPLLWRLPLIGLLTGGLLLLIPNLSDNTSIIEAAIAGLFDGNIIVWLLVAKIVATILCLSVGYAGGIVSPTLVIGGLLGALLFNIIVWFWSGFAVIVPLPMAILCGMVALTAPVIGAPMTAILLVMEFSQNYQTAIMATICVSIATRLHSKLGGLSYYDMQILANNGDDMRIRRDEWIFQTHSIAAFVQPANCIVKSSCSINEVIKTAIDVKSNDVFIINEDSQFMGQLKLFEIVAVQDKTQAIGSIAPKNPLAVESSQSMIQTLRLMQLEKQHILAVVEQGQLLGIIDENILSANHDTLIREERQENS